MHEEQAEGRARRTVFLSALKHGRSVTSAAMAAGINRSLVYKWREAMPDFAKAWDEAVETAADLIEEEAWRRALQGVQKPVFWRGEQIGVVTTYSDRLLMFLLQRLRPVAPPARPKAKAQYDGPTKAELEAAFQRLHRHDAEQAVAEVAEVEMETPVPPAPDTDDAEEASPSFAPRHDDAPPDDAVDALPPPLRVGSPDVIHGPPLSQMTRSARPTPAEFSAELRRRPDPGFARFGPPWDGSANRRRSPVG